MELAVRADDGMGDVVAIAEDDRRSGRHDEFLWSKGEIIDIHLGTGSDRGQGHNDAESGDRKSRGTNPSAIRGGGLL